MTTIAHSVEFDAPPAEIFEMYADSRKHAKVIDGRARLERRVGGRFSAWGGGVNGMNVVLRAPTLIVQAWRTQDFPKDITPSCISRSSQRAAVGRG